MLIDEEDFLAMIPFVSVIGRSKTGKTTLIKNLIRELRIFGYRIAVIKHDPHDHGEIDRKGSDTWIFREEGSQAVILASPSKVTLFRQTVNEQFPEELFPLCGDVDLIILEGYKKRDYPKLVIWTRKKEELAIEPHWTVLAVLYPREEEKEAKQNFEKTNVPLFCRDDASKIASFIEQALLKKEKEKGGK